MFVKGGKIDPRHLIEELKERGMGNEEIAGLAKRDGEEELTDKDIEIIEQIRLKYQERR